jgi:carboxypeptidase Q
MHASALRCTRLLRAARLRRSLPIGLAAGLVAALVAPMAGQTRGSAHAAAAPASVAAAAAVADTVDYDAMYRIKEEATTHSQVMQTLSYLTDVNGPRLTNSPGMHAAAEWAKKQLTDWGLTNPHFEKWGPFGKGWENQRFSAMMTAPQPFVLQGYPKAWTPGTNGPVTADVVLATLNTAEDLDKAKGTLKGKIVLLTPAPVPAAFSTLTGRAAPSPGNPSFEPLIHRYTESDLADLQKETVRPLDFARLRGGAFGPAATDFRKKRMAFLLQEGAVAMVEGSRGEGNGVIFVQGAQAGEEMRLPDSPQVLPQIVLAAEHYGRLVRILEKKVPVSIDLNVQNRFTSDDLNSLNVVAELPGTDKKDEIVMIGAHFDSWQAGTGATDNGISSAVMMEVMRILKASGLRPRRTIRMGLWTGEEQGLLGSRAYVTEHFADRSKMDLKPEHGKLSVYLNMDNGGGTFRGIYLQGNAAAASIFQTWAKPFESFGMTMQTIRNTGGTDHLSFDAVGLPGFQFVQDPLDYDTRTHHTNLDLYERVFPEDVIKNAIVIATFAYEAANRDQMFPRKPLPKPQSDQFPGATPAPAARPTTTSGAGSR